MAILVIHQQASHHFMAMMVLTFFHILFEGAYTVL